MGIKKEDTALSCILPKKRYVVVELCRFPFRGWYALGAIPPQTRMNTGFLPFFKPLPEQHMFNEWYARDISNTNP